MFGSIFGDAEAKPEETSKEAPEKKEEDVVTAAEESPIAEVKEAEEPPVAEVKEAEEPPTSIFGSVFGPANPEQPVASEEQPVAAVAAIPDGNRVTKRKRKKRRNTNKKGIARCTAYCRMQAKKRFCPKERMSTPYYQE
jgi:hypothetical protein